MIPCEEFEELLSAFVDGEVTPDEQTKIEEHIQSCKACASLLKLYQAASNELSALPEPPESFRKNVMDRIATLPEKPNQRGKLIFIKPWMATAAAAACLALVVLISPLRGALQPKKSAQDEGHQKLAMAPNAIPEPSTGTGAGTALAPEEDDAFGMLSAAGVEDCDTPEEGGLNEAVPAPSANEKEEDQNRKSDVIGGIEMAERPTTHGILGFAPPKVGLGATCAVEITDAAKYYAVITVRGELPEALLGTAFTATDGGYETAEISAETARALIDAGYEAVYGGADNKVALVVYYP